MTLLERISLAALLLVHHNTFLTKSQLLFTSLEHRPSCTIAPALGSFTYKHVPAAKL